MINPAETLPPRRFRENELNTDQTAMPTALCTQKEQAPSMSPGDLIAESYVITGLMAEQGKQADVYLAQKWGKTYVIKAYKDGWYPSGPVRSFLAGIRHENIAHVVESGKQNGRYYEVYEYYPEGTLEQEGPLPASHIQSVIVPSLNEGLHQLHKSGLVHCDIKPSNLFYADGKTRVVIGDCGISGYVNDTGKFIDAIRGTPEYAPPVKSILWSAAIDFKYDYGSFGLVLCRAILGWSLFKDMSVEEISKTWVQGFKLPAKISGRLHTLIQGLLNADEEQRWGYEQVKRWCEGEFIQTNRRILHMKQNKDVPIRPLIFGRFDGALLSVSSLHQLAVATRNHWDQATRVIKRGELVDFVAQFDKDGKQDLATMVRSLARCHDADAAVFKMLLCIDDEPLICYCGKTYDSLEVLIEQLSSGKDDVAKRFVASGLLVSYMRWKGYDDALVGRLEQLIAKNGCGDMVAITTICFALQGTKSVNVFGVMVESLDELPPILASRSIPEVDRLLDQDTFIAWLNRLGYEKAAKKIRPANKCQELN